jgi:hypothetical protein
LVLNPIRNSGQLVRLRQEATEAIESFFGAAIDTAAQTAHAVLSRDLRKAEKDDHLTREDIDSLLDAILRVLAWASLAKEMDGLLEEASDDGVDHAIHQLQEAGLLPFVAQSGAPTVTPLPTPGLSESPATSTESESTASRPIVARTQSFISETHEEAADFAHDRAAELVGMKWVDGELVDNPNAQWAITDTTRTMLRQIIEDSFRRSSSIAELTEALEQAGVFSNARAKLIARTEINRAQSGAHYQTWLKSRVVKGTRWMVSNAHDQDDECDENEEAGFVPLGEPYPSGDLYPPAHPNCCCTAVAMIERPK